MLESAPVSSQAVLAGALKTAGMGVTQATLSRDLKELGVVKGREGYQLPDTPSSAGTKETGVLSQHTLAVRAANGLVVVRTTPGSAQVVALDIDRLPPSGVAGTVAGDDTVLVAVFPDVDVDHVVESLQARAALGNAGDDASVGSGL